MNSDIEILEFCSLHSFLEFYREYPILQSLIAKSRVYEAQLAERKEELK